MAHSAGRCSRSSGTTYPGGGVSETRIIAYKGDNVVVVFCPACLSYDIAEGKENFKRLICHDCNHWWAPLEALEGIDFGLHERPVNPSCLCHVPVPGTDIKPS
jgi:hypothetical protein